MDQTLQRIFELSRDPMLAVEDGRLLAMNAAAQQLFPEYPVGSDADALLPAYVLEEPAERFLSSLSVNGAPYSVSAVRAEARLLLSLTALRPDRELRSFLSDSMISNMLSALCNLGLAMERLQAELPEDLSGNTDRYFAILNHNYYVLSHKLSNLNLLCAINEDSMAPIPHYTDLTRLCQNLADTVSLLTQNTHARIEFHSTEYKVAACLDAPKIERLILNLLSNSLAHTPKDGRIRMRLTVSGGNAVLSVDDNGCGIPPERLKTLFSAFETRYGEHNLQPDNAGGLGLALCQAIVEKHGGSMLLESRVGEGCSVRVLLPLWQNGGRELHGDSGVYDNGGMRVILTELCDVLDSSFYAPEYTD